MKRTPLARRTPLRSGGPLPAVNATRKAKRRKTYAAHLRSSYWRALRQLVFRRDGWRCTALCEIPPRRGIQCLTVTTTIPRMMLVQCGYVDESKTGDGLELDHLTYARFGKELEEDVTTRCTYHHRLAHALEGKRPGR